MNKKPATLRFWTLQLMAKESGPRVILIPFSLQVENEPALSLHVRAVRRRDGPVDIQFTAGQALTLGVEAIKAVANKYYTAAVEAAGKFSGRQCVRFVREYPVSL